MGVYGAAIATVISQGVSFMWVVSFFIGKEDVLPYKKRKSDSEGRDGWEDNISWNIGICYAGN